jgi:hypothetical protein
MRAIGRWRAMRLRGPIPSRSKISISIISWFCVSRIRRAGIVAACVGVTLLAGCESYPAADDVAACAAARFGTEQGSFNVTKGPGSLFSPIEYTITYQKAGSADRAVVIYCQRKGPVTTQVEISYGNHAEIAGAADAIKFCAQPR